MCGKSSYSYNFDTTKPPSIDRPTALPFLLILTVTFDFDLWPWFSVRWEPWSWPLPHVYNSKCQSVQTVASLLHLGLGHPTPRGPSLESIYRVSLTVDVWEGNKIISFKKLFQHSQLGAPQKEKNNPGALGTCPVCPLVKTALSPEVTVKTNERTDTTDFITFLDC